MYGPIGEKESEEHHRVGEVGGGGHGLTFFYMHSIGIGARYDPSLDLFGRRSSFCTARDGSIIIYNGYEHV